MPRSSDSIGSIIALSTLSSATTPLADSWLSQKLVSPILASSAFLRAVLVGKSKRVPDGEHPGAEVFDGGGEVVVDHGGSYRRWGGGGQGRSIGCGSSRSDQGRPTSAIRSRALAEALPR